jgi:RNA polymerase sigma factor (sigma-70 family)
VANGDPGAYLHRCVVNTFLTRRRRRSSSERPMDHPPDRVDDTDAYNVADVRDALDRLVPTLPPRQRATVVLRYFEDLTEGETAAALGCTVGTVKSQCASALAKLRTLVIDSRLQERHT